MAKVAVVVLACDRPQFMHEALQSVARQTFSDFEVVVSDCSQHEPNAKAYDHIVDGFIRDFPSIPVRRIRQSSRLRQGPHQQAAISHSTSPYIALLDDDDAWKPHHLAQSIDWLDRRPDHGLTTSNSMMIDASGNLLGTAKDLRDLIPDESDRRAWLEFVLRSWYGSTSGLVVRRAALGHHSYFDTPIVDVHMTISTLLAGYRVRGFREPSYLYRVHEQTFYSKGLATVLARHRLRKQLWREHGLRMVAATPLFPLLLAKSVLESPILAWHLRRQPTLQK
jgi:glycosyltransferase involved in cell wall biosynthesis